MPDWAYIIIAVVGVLALFYLFGGLLYLIARKRERPVYEELNSLSSFEEERGKKVLACLDNLDRHGYNFGDEAEQVIRKGVADFKSLDPDSKAKYKNTVELTAFLLVKVYAEDKRYGQFITREEAGSFKMYPADGDEAYKKYNK